MFQDQNYTIIVIYVFQDQYSKLTTIYIFQNQEPLILILIVQNFVIYLEQEYNIDRPYLRCHLKLKPLRKLHNAQHMFVLKEIQGMGQRNYLKTTR